MLWMAARRCQAHGVFLEHVLAEFDWCAFGALVSLGVLAFKPWRVATTVVPLALALEQHRCSKDHAHGSFSGVWAIASWHYPRALRQEVVQILQHTRWGDSWFFHTVRQWNSSHCQVSSNSFTAGRLRINAPRRML